MGIKLDWEIEAEQSTVKGAGEDKKSVRRRRAAQLRILFGVAVVIAIFGALFGVFWWRLQTVNAEIERALVDTVDAEVATLRVSDKNAYINIQRSAGDVWLDIQRNTFDEYQNLKVNYDVQLTGNVVNVEVDDSRGRVQVEEIIDGVPYVQTWFYWRYAEDGWRHVPPDYTFWGTSETIERNRVVVRYQSIDELLAEAMASELERWVIFACDALICTDLPLINVDIIPNEGMPVGWDENNLYTLRIPSPFTGRARLDRPFDTALQIETANLIAERIVTFVAGGVQPPPLSDAAYLRSAIQDWLVSTFTLLDTQSHLITTYATRYGNPAVGAVLRDLNNNPGLQVLNAPAGVGALSDLEVDWRDYLTWRINLESQLQANQDQVNFVALYAPEAVDLAFSRFQQPIPDERREVVSVQSVIGADGASALEAIVRYGEGETARDETVRFRLADGVWKRIN